MENHKQDSGGSAEEHDPVREREAVASKGQLPGSKAVLREDRREPREVRVGGVGGEQEDARCPYLVGIVQDVFAQYFPAEN